MDQVPAPAFDYGALDPDAGAYVQAQRDRIKVLARRSAEDIVEIGTALRAVKARLPHGRFGAWLKTEFGWSHQTARRFMQVAEAFPEIAHGERFEPTALYLLAADDIPPAVREHYLAEAAGGRYVTARAVRTELTPLTHEARRVAAQEAEIGATDVPLAHDVDDGLSLLRDVLALGQTSSDPDEYPPGWVMRRIEAEYDACLEHLEQATDAVLHLWRVRGSEAWILEARPDLRRKRTELTERARDLLRLCEEPDDASASAS